MSVGQGGGYFGEGAQKQEEDQREEKNDFDRAEKTKKKAPHAWALVKKGLMSWC